MKKNILFLILAFIISFVGVDDVFAASGKLTITSNVTSAATNTKFNVYVTYTGDTLGSINMQTTFTNATCTLYAQADGFTRNCTTSGCKIVFEDYNTGYKSGTRFATFACTGTASPAKFSASVINGDAWNFAGDTNVTVASGNFSLPITNVTTTTKKTTTTTKKPTTTTKKTTTKSTTKQVTTKTTTKGKTTTTTKKPTTTTKRPQTSTTLSTTKGNIVITQPITTTHTTTTEVVTTSINHLPDDMKLKELKIVGYEIEFNKNNTGYQIELADDVDEIYIIATPVDRKNSVENTGVVNVEGLSNIKVRVYNELVEEEVIYNIKIIRKKTTRLQDFYSKIFKPTIAVAVILFTLFLLGVYFYNLPKNKLEKITDNDGEEVSYKNGNFVLEEEVKEHKSFLQSPNLEISTDVPIKTIQAKNVSLNRKKREVLEKKLSEVGIEEIPDNEQQLTKVLIQLNKTNVDENNNVVSENTETKKIKISKPDGAGEIRRPVSTKIKINVDNDKVDLSSENLMDRLESIERVKIQIKKDE